MFTGTCFRHAENTIYFFSTYRNTSSCMAYAITKAGVRWFLDSYPMPMPLNLMALEPITFFLFCFFLQIIQSLSFSAVFCYINVTKSFECCLTGAGMRSQHTCFTPESHHHPNIE